MQLVSRSFFVEIRPAIVRVAKNAHFWVVVVLSAWLLFIYQAWPWPERRFAQGAWRFFGWLSALEPLVINVEVNYHIFGVLFLIPIIYGSLTLSWQGGIFAWLLALAWVLPTLLSWGNSVHWISLALLLLPALLVAAVTGERRWREREKRFFAEREKERRAYIAKLVEAQEAERRRIAQELHDETLQTLMVIANKSDSLALSAPNESQVDGNLWIKQEVLHTMDDLRRLSMNLRPSILDNFGLVSGIRWLVNNSNHQNACRLDIAIAGEERRMSSLSEVTVFRVVQEAINNIQRHAQAERGTVLLEFEHDSLKVTITDDGVGFQPPERLGSYVSESKLGVLGIEQRILSIGGTMKIESSPGAGTELSARIPYEASAQVVETEDA
jgi:two-component system, NarL family, sensor histidine kinase DegS